MSYTRQQLEELARQKAREQGLREDVFLRLVGAESSWNPQAKSPAGAEGLGQLMPATAKGLGVTNPFDPIQSLTGSSKYLKQQLDRFGGNYNKAVAAYNAGPGTVERYGGIPPFRETQGYVQKVLGGIDLKTPYQSTAKPSGADPTAATPSTSGFLQGFIAALEGNEFKQPSVNDLIKQELMGQILSPPTKTIDLFQTLLNANLYE